MHGAGKKVIFNKDIAGTISHTSNADGEDFIIEQVGPHDASFWLLSEGTGTDAIDIYAENGGVIVDAAATKDVLVTGGQVHITSKQDTPESIRLLTNPGSTTATINVTNTSGTDPAAINLEASAGGVLVSADGDIANAIKLHATAGTAQTIVLLNTAGASSGAIAFTSSAGGVDINGGTGVTVDGTGISIDGTTASNFTVTGSGANLTLAAAGGGTQQLVLSSAGTDAQAINIDASAGMPLVISR